MTLQDFPFLTIIVFLPAVVGLLLMLLPKDREKLIYNIALVAGLVTFILSVVVYFSFDQSLAASVNERLAAGELLPASEIYQFYDEANWLPALGISYKVGVDGMNTPLVLLTGLVMFTGVIISQRVAERKREFFAFLFILATGVFGVFVALDMFVLFFFYEIAVFPMYLLIAIWGWKETREYAAMKLTLYLVIGSVVALVGALAIYFASPVQTFDLVTLERAGFGVEFQRLWFPFVFIGFAILGGIFPFHNWSPDGHVAAPTAVSMFHAGVLMKLGAFAALRIGIMLLPEGAKFHLPWMILLTLVNVVYGAYIAMVQTDFKYVIGFSSVSHMGLVVMGFATLNHDGMLGAGVQMVSHGVMTALFFAVVGMIYDQVHTRQLDELGGMVKYIPQVTFAFIIGGLVSMGMPGFSGFIAEFPIFMGVWGEKIHWAADYPNWLSFLEGDKNWIAIAAAISIVITAAYIIRLIRRVFFGEFPKEFEGHMHDVRPSEKLALVLLCLVLVGIGIFPSVMVPMVETGVERVLILLGGM
ncbi:MAG TPA: NADH-quinone oxidoreductase subunit M [Anaerolineales bacterium]|nr:NADH-quinone oxidoreductase subunit M [Anaerolineales bacterium]